VSLYDLYVETFACPSCASPIRRAQTKFGVPGLREYRDGDVVEWFRGSALHNGGRLEGGNMRGAARASCDGCGLSVFLLIRVREDVIAGVGAGSVRRARPTDYGAKFVGFAGLDDQEA